MLEYQELQAKSINKILGQAMEEMEGEYIKNKIAYLIFSKDKNIIQYLEKISLTYKIIDSSLQENNYKRALRYTCLLKMYVKKIVQLIS